MQTDFSGNPITNDDNDNDVTRLAPAIIIFHIFSYRGLISRGKIVVDKKSERKKKKIGRNLKCDEHKMMFSKVRVINKKPSDVRPIGRLKMK